MLGGKFLYFSQRKPDRLRYLPVRQDVHSDQISGICKSPLAVMKSLSKFDHEGRLYFSASSDLFEESECAYKQIQNHLHDEKKQT